MTLANPVGATLGSQKTATVTIVDNDQGFQFEFASYSVAEDAGVVRIGVLRGTDDTNSTVTVDFATSDLTATNGLDYTGITNTLSFAPGEKVKLVTVPILNDGVKEPTKNFRVTLSNPTGGAVLGSRTTATVTIVDNDPGMGFELGSYSVWENAGAITVTVLRGNDVALGPITVDYATSNLTAKAGQDYQAVSGTLAFEENETVKTITIPILRNGLVTNDTSFRVTLSNPTGGATLGTASTTVNILNAPELGTFRTVAPPFDTALTIRRDGGRQHPHLERRRPTAKSGPPDGALADAHERQQSVHSSVCAPDHVLPGHPPQAGEPLHPLELRRPNAGAPGDPPARLRRHRCRPGRLHAASARWRRREDFSTATRMARSISAATSSGTPPMAVVIFFNTGVDDAGYLRALIEEIGRQFAVDRKRIHLIGHSNGGFMAYRMACQSADLIAGIASLAGATFLDPSRCAPSQPVNILHIHGTADDTFLTLAASDGSQYAAFPGALQTVQIWAGYNGARDPVTDPGPSMDLDLDVPGLDTVITRYTNYPPGGAVELWTINGGSHAPTFYSGSSASEFAPRVIDWLLAHPKP